MPSCGPAPYDGVEFGDERQRVHQVLVGEGGLVTKAFTGDRQRLHLLERAETSARRSAPGGTTPGFFLASARTTWDFYRVGGDAVQVAHQILRHGEHRLGGDLTEEAGRT